MRGKRALQGLVRSSHFSMGPHPSPAALIPKYFLDRAVFLLQARNGIYRLSGVLERICPPCRAPSDHIALGVSERDLLSFVTHTSYPPIIPNE